MTLANRVSAFFLVALALALAAYSLAFYLLVRNYLNRQFDDDLHSALQILSSSVEVEPDDAKWHPAEHGIDLNQHILNEVIWIVADERGQVVDRSPHARRGDSAFTTVRDYARESHPDANSPIELGQWRVMQAELSAPAPKPLAEREAHEYATLRITVARSRSDLDAVLNRLALLVVVLPAVVWIAAAAIGQALVRRALRPVRDMADRAGSMTRADFNLRLPVATSNDELSELAAMFNHLLDQLQSAYDRQQRFTGDAAHQLRTPLAVLQGQLDVALRRPRPTEEYQHTLSLLSDQTAELRQVVESLLFLARSQDEGATLNFERVDLKQWTPQYVDHWSNHPRAKDLVTQFDSPAMVRASTLLLTQLLNNLIGNAFKYSDRGTKVEIRVATTGEHVSIAITDQGIGIAANEVRAVFEPFYRSEQARRQGIAGTGLGLSVGARIAAALGGELTCRSKLGDGSTFTLTLPAAMTSERPAPRPAAV
jgi:heavy metal sensor kinase